MTGPFGRIEVSVVAVGLALVSGCTQLSGALPSVRSIEPVAAIPFQVRTPGGSPPLTSIVPATIDPTGDSDVSDDLQAFLDQVPDGTRVVFPRDARYTLSRGIRLDDRRDLHFEGNGSTLTASGCSQASSPFLIGMGGGSDGIRIRGFRLEGSNDRAGTLDAFDGECEHQHGVAVYASSRVEVVDVSIGRMHGDCLYLAGGGDPFRWSSDVWFHDSRCELVGRQGVAIIAARRVVLERIHVDKVGIAAFDIEPNDAREGAHDVVIQDNTVGEAGLSHRFEHVFFAANGNLDASVRNVLVRGNTVTGGTLETIVGDELQGWNGTRNHVRLVFTGNRSTEEARGPVLLFKHVAGLTVSGNHQPLSSGPLVELVDCVDVTIDAA